MATVLNNGSDANANDRIRATRDEAFARIIGNSPSLTQVSVKARMLANVDAAVPLHGETGVGS